jgi:uncharacterized protein (TIGR02678 family)
MSDHAARLADVLDRQRDDERERALRALLARPLLTDASAELALVRRHAQYLRDWLARETGWVLRVERGFARLYKRPAATDDATRGLPGFGRDLYTLFCLVCAVLERAEAQITLKALGERLLEAVADPELATRGFAFTLEHVRERRALVRVCKLLLEYAVFARVAGDEEAYVNRAGDALYDVNHRVLATLPASTRGASYIAGAEDAPADLEARLAALVEEYVPDGAEGHRSAARHSLARRFLDDPVTYHDELGDDERRYLATQRGPMSARLAQAVGLVPELRAEGVALVDRDGELTDEHLPAVGTEAHATLLVAEYLASAARSAGAAGGAASDAAGAGDAAGAAAGDTGAARFHSMAELAAFLREAADEYGRYWRKDAREPGAESALAEEAVTRLARLKLVRREGAAVVARPALLRYAVRTARVEPLRSQRTLL